MWVCDAKNFQTSATALVYSPEEYSCYVWEPYILASKLEVRLNEAFTFINSQPKVTLFSSIHTAIRFAPPDFGSKATTYFQSQKRTETPSGSPLKQLNTLFRLLLRKNFMEMTFMPASDLPELLKFLFLAANTEPSENNY